MQLNFMNSIIMQYTFCLNFLSKTSNQNYQAWSTIQSINSWNERESFDNESTIVGLHCEFKMELSRSHY